MKKTLMVVVLALAFAGVGCGGGSGSSESAESESTSGAETAAARVVAPGEATIGDTTTCPVSGEQFVVTAESPHVEHEGRTYYFCCPGCDQRFQANPQQFLTPAAESTEAASAS